MKNIITFLDHPEGMSRGLLVREYKPRAYKYGSLVSYVDLIDERKEFYRSLLQDQLETAIATAFEIDENPSLVHGKDEIINAVAEKDSGAIVVVEFGVGEREITTISNIVKISAIAKPDVTFIIIAPAVQFVDTKIRNFSRRYYKPAEEYQMKIYNHKIDVIKKNLINELIMMATT